MKFRLLHGVHSEKDRSYKAGDVVVSVYPLDRLFVGRFERLHDEPQPPAKLPKAGSSKGGT